jgi:hypothetical protein
VFPKARYQLALLVSEFVETFFEDFVGQLSCLWEALHATLGSDEDAAIFDGFISELLFVDDFIRKIT